MRQSSLAPIAPPIVGVPAVLLGALPGWCLPVLVGVSILLTATEVVVKQVIRLRASSQDALEVLRIEDLPHHRRPRGRRRRSSNGRVSRVGRPRRRKRRSTDK